MKAKILGAIAGLSVASVGALAGITSFFPSYKPVEVKAASGDVTFYFDYTAAGWWGGDSAVTKLEDNNGIRYETTLAYSGSSVYKVTVNTASLTSVKFVRLDPNNLASKPWNETAEVTNFANNYCNIYDNGYGSLSFSWVASKTNYVLDMSGGLLGATHNAHIWTNGDAASTSFPGRQMNQVGSSRFYEVTFKGSFANIIFTNKNTGEGQTGNLSTGSDGQVWVLQSDWNGAWVSYEAATFIDQYMHFSDVSTSATGSTANCATYYDAAKEHYNALSSNAVRSEVLSVKNVKDRLEWWAKANGAALDENGGVLAAGVLPSITNNGDTNRILMVVTVSTVAVAALGGWFALRKKKSVN